MKNTKKLFQNRLKWLIEEYYFNEQRFMLMQGVSIRLSSYKKGGKMKNKAKKSVASFEESRTKLLNSFRARARDQVIEKEIHFSDDVPAFLRQLNEFEKRSRKTVITVK